MSSEQALAEMCVWYLLMTLWHHNLEHLSSEEQKEPNTFIDLFKLMLVLLGQCPTPKNIYQG